MGAHALAFSMSNHINGHHVNTDINNNDHSQLLETPRKKIRNFIYFGDTKIHCQTQIFVDGGICISIC